MAEKQDSTEKQDLASIYQAVQKYGTLTDIASGQVSTSPFRMISMALALQSSGAKIPTSPFSANFISGSAARRMGMSPEAALEAARTPAPTPTADAVTRKQPAKKSSLSASRRGRSSLIKTGLLGNTGEARNSLLGNS